MTTAGAPGVASLCETAVATLAALKRRGRGGPCGGQGSGITWEHKQWGEGAFFLCRISPFLAFSFLPIAQSVLENDLNYKNSSSDSPSSLIKLFLLALPIFVVLHLGGTANGLTLGSEC